MPLRRPAPLAHVAATLAATVATVAALGAASTAGAQNLALNRPVFASSVDPDYTLPESVDGDRAFTIVGTRGFSTGVENRAWWYVDLGADYDLTRIEFYGRPDGPRVRLSGATIGLFAGVPYTVGSPAPVESWTFPVSTVYGNGPNPINPYPVDLVFTSTTNAVGRYVGIRSALNGEPLNFAEVEVYAAAPQQVVPEPSTWAMLGGGLVGLGFVARRRAQGGGRATA